MSEPGEDQQPDLPPPRNHRELAERAGIDMSWMDELEQRQRLEVFGEERLGQDGQEATEPTVGQLTTTLETLCLDERPNATATLLGGARISRILDQETGSHTTIHWDKERSPHVLDNQWLVKTIGLESSRSQDADGRSVVITEDIGVLRDNGLPRIIRSVATDYDDGRRSQTAEKDATEQEVRDKLEKVEKAVREDDRVRAHRRKMSDIALNPRKANEQTLAELFKDREVVGPPNCYRREIVETADGKRLVLAGKLPADFRPNTYFVIHIDEDGVPMPQEQVQQIGVMRVGEDTEFAEPGYHDYGKPERHFRLGGATIDFGIYDADQKIFGPFFKNGHHVFSKEWGLNEAVGALSPELDRQNPGLAEILGLTIAIMERDWPDINSRHRATTLVNYATDAAVFALYTSRLVTFAQKPGQPLEEVPLFKDIETAIADDYVWSRIRKRGDTDRERADRGYYLERLREDILYVRDGEHQPRHGNLKSVLEEIVSILLEAKAQEILEVHADDIKALDDAGDSGGSC